LGGTRAFPLSSVSSQLPNVVNGENKDELRESNEKIKNHGDTGDILHPLQALERDIAVVLNNITAAEDTSIHPIIFTMSSLTITRVWDLELWSASTSRMRYIRFIFNLFNSRLMRRIAPQLLACITWSIVCVSVITTRVKKATTHFVPLTSLSLVSTFIAFLLTVRSNQSLDRLGEARQLWGRLFIVTRDTAQMIAAYIYPKDKKLGLKAARHMSIFAWLLKDHLRGTNNEDIIRTMLSDSGTDLSFVTSQRKKTAAAIARIRQIVADTAARDLLASAPHRQLERNLNEMNYILGMCERLRGSPIPPVYTSHTSRLLVFYLLCLPLALHGSQASRLVTVLVTSTVSYAMLGLDEISHVLEQPFALMPLHQLNRHMMCDIGDAFVCRPPPLGKSEVTIIEKEPKPSYW